MKLLVFVTILEYEVTFIDEFVDWLLIKDSVCDITLPRLPKRRVLEENNELVPRVSTLEKELEEEFKLME